MSGTRSVESEDGWKAFAYGVKSVAVVDPEGNEKLHMQIHARVTDEQLHSFIGLAKSFAADKSDGAEA